MGKTHYIDNMKPAETVLTLHRRLAEKLQIDDFCLTSGWGRLEDDRAIGDYIINGEIRLGLTSRNRGGMNNSSTHDEPGDPHASGSGH
jgi:hypothetical protein